MKLNCRTTKIILAACLLAFALLLAGCGLGGIVDSGGSVTETGNPKLSAKLVTPNGSPAQGAWVQLVPGQYNPGKDAPLPDSSRDTTDESGEYELSADSGKVYNILSFHPSTGHRSMALRILAPPRDTVLPEDTLAKTVTILIPIVNSLRDSNGYVYLQGTTNRGRIEAVDGDSAFVLDSVPTGDIPAVYYDRASDTFSTPAEIYDDTTISQDTVRLAPTRYRRKKIYVDSAEQLDPSIRLLSAGDSLIVRQGTYDTPVWNITNLRGSDTARIVITGEPGTIIRGNSGSHNLLEMSGLHYVTVSGLTITSGVTNGASNGVKIGGSAKSTHVTMENLYIRSVTGNGIGISADSCSHIVIRNCEIDSADLIGINVGNPGVSAASSVDILNNYIHHCPSNPATTGNAGIKIHGGSYNCRILDNTLHDVGSADNCGINVFFGKNAATGDIPGEINLVRGNVLWNARNEGISGNSDATIENNIVFDAVRGIHLQQAPDDSTGSPGAIENLRVMNNTVFRCSQACVLLSGWENAASSTLFTGNALYQPYDTVQVLSSTGFGPATIAGNIYFGSSISSSGFVAGKGLGDFASVTATAAVPALDFYPAAGSALIDVTAIASGYASEDFDGTVRPINALPDAGAYEYTVTGASGWTIKEGFKNK